MGKIASLIDAGMSLDNQAKARKLDAEFTDLAKKEVMLKAQVQKLEAKVNPLEREIVQLKEKIAHLTGSPKLDFDQRTGAYVDASGQHYCTKCECESGKRNPLKNDTNGWRCMACTKYFPDPSRPEPRSRVTTWNPNDPNMGY